MAIMNFEACYAALELPFGAGPKEVNGRWRKLSQIHHPDRHASNPSKYQAALEKQKQLNNARDVLKKWFEMNPQATPPRSTSSSQQTHTQNKSANANTSTNSGANKSQSNNAGTQTNQGPQSKQQQSGAQQSHRQGSSQAKSSTTSQRASAKPPDTGWFTASVLKLTPLQELVQEIEKRCNGGEPSFLALTLIFAVLFGPMFVITGILGAIFPELPGHYPDWLMMPMLGSSGWCTCYILRWYDAKTKLIKLQQKEMYFRSSRSIGDTVDLAKSIIGKHTVSNETWKFVATGAIHEATLHFEEEVFHEMKRSRCLKIRFEARPGTSSVVFAMHITATSPLNSFTCKQLAEKIIADFKKELHHLAT